ncbi:MAG: formylmethanofuran dehydrogenase subunit E family protein [Syntrophobacteraceae bacterium]|nr:formylmethanofuran dehydrogenase subunit E family protein [Syntrophobacteraceae bacterium]
MYWADGNLQVMVDGAEKFHGHLCEGLVLGVRMALAALRELGIEDSKGPAGKDLVIFVETDRCPVDGIIAVTGRTPGKRSIKMMDYGKPAATFIETRSSNCVRVSARADFNEKVGSFAKSCFPRMEGKPAKVAAMAMVPENDLLRLQRVGVELCARDLPGKSHRIHKLQRWAMKSR